MKKALSIVLALVIALSCTVPAFAKEEKSTQVYNGYPLVLVRGMDFSGLRYKRGTDEEQNCLGHVEAKDIIGTVGKALGKALISFSIDSGIKVVADYLEEIFGLMACNPDGTSKYDVSVPAYPKSLSHYENFNDWEKIGSLNEYGILKNAVKNYGAKNVYYYNYDWRLDPLTHADSIDALVKQAIRETGKSKVNLICCSMGGIETMAYLYKYGHSKLNRLIFLSSTAYGAHVATDLFRGIIDIDADYLYAFLDKMVAKDNKALKILFKTLYVGGVFDGLSNFANFLVCKLKEKVYDAFLTDTFGTMPALWSLVLPHGYDAAVKYMFGGKEQKYAKLIALTKEYQKIHAKRTTLLKNAEKAGVNVCIVASYDSPCVPVYPGGGCNGDGTLEADRMLGGAKVAKLGETLSEEYIAANPGRISPDKSVDLSTVDFPATTWAIKGGIHVACSYGTDHQKFIFRMLEYNGKFTVDTDKKYPQFLVSPTGQDLA